MNGKRQNLPLAPGKFWFCILAAPLAWLFQELASWLLLNATCLDPAAGNGSSTSRLAISAISIVALLLTLVTLAYSIVLYRRHGNLQARGLSGDRLSAFQSAIALLINGVFLLAIGWASWPLLSLPLCEALR